MSPQKILAAACRAGYLAIIVWQVLLGNVWFLAWGGTIYLVTAVMLYFAHNQERAYAVDAALMMLFSVAAVGGHILGFHFDTTIWGIDKVFHAIGGALLGWFALVAYRPHIKNRAALFSVCVLFALALGAAWEGFEFAHMVLRGAAPAEYDRLLFADTMLDLVADTTGAIILAGLSLVSAKQPQFSLSKDK